MGTCRELAETILDSGDTLVTILGDILDFSKIDHNSMVLEATPVSLRATIESTVEMVAADAVRRGIEIAYVVEDRMLSQKVLGDAIRIRQVPPPPSLQLELPPAPLPSTTAPSLTVCCPSLPRPLLSYLPFPPLPLHSPSFLPPA